MGTGAFLVRQPLKCPATHYHRQPSVGNIRLPPNNIQTHLGRGQVYPIIAKTIRGAAYPRNVVGYSVQKIV